MIQMKKGPVSTTYLEAMEVIRHKLRYDDYEMDTIFLDDIMNYNKTELYNRLATSIAPEIFGMEDVKKALLLQLVGGVTKNRVDDGLKIRGDINICLMGDPGLAKSVCFKYKKSNY
jgi:DNA replication licensing factor MCM7